MASTITYEVRVLRHVLESCDWLASRGRDGLAKLKEMARETKWHDGDARHERVALPENWSRAIPLHGAVMNGHYQTTLPYLVETLGAPVGGVCPRDGNTPCHTAVVWGHLHVVAYLLARGARHDAKNDHGFDLAALARRRQERLERGSDIDRAYYTRNGVPLQALIEEGARLTRLLEGVARAGGWDAGARPRATRSQGRRRRRPGSGNGLRRDLAALRANCKGMEKQGGAGSRGGGGGNETRSTSAWHRGAPRPWRRRARPSPRQTPAAGRALQGGSRRRAVRARAALAGRGDRRRRPGPGSNRGGARRRPDVPSAALAVCPSARSAPTPSRRPSARPRGRGRAPPDSAPDAVALALLERWPRARGVIARFAYAAGCR